MKNTFKSLLRNNTLFAPKKSVLKNHKLYRFYSTEPQPEASAVPQNTAATQENNKQESTSGVEYLYNSQGLNTPLKFAERRWWFSVDPNIGLITDKFNPKIVLNLKDKEGNNYVQNLKYKSSIRSIGFKPEVSLRFHVGYLRVHEESKATLQGIPRKITIPSRGWNVNFMAFQFVSLPLPELNSTIYYFGPGIGFFTLGATMIQGGEVELVTEPTAVQVVPKASAAQAKNFIPIMILLMIYIGIPAFFFILLAGSAALFGGQVIKEGKDVFDQMDEDKDGFISRTDMHIFLQDNAHLKGQTTIKGVIYERIEEVAKKTNGYEQLNFVQFLEKSNQLDKEQDAQKRRQKQRLN